MEWLLMKFKKDEYILRSLSKIKHKKWELFIISRIIHLLDEPNLEFVCQQLIRKQDNKHYFTDLCFPALELYYEIDEEYHTSKIQEENDQIRKLEIIDATKFEERRIQANNLDLEVVMQNVDKEIYFIKDRKKEYELKRIDTAWNYDVKFDPETYCGKGYIDVEDNVCFHNHRDAMRCFGYTGGHYQRAIWQIPEDDRKIWFPKLYENNDWNNSLVCDGKKIIEQKTNGEDIYDPKHKKRIVFAHNRNILGQIVYKFLGEFKFSEEKSSKKEHVHIRQETRISLRRGELP